MKYKHSAILTDAFIKENIMGPNPAKLLEQIIMRYPLEEEATVLDLGCGKGVTSIMLAKAYGLKVFATDLWITPTENKKRFDEAGLTREQIVPISAEAHALPYAEAFFDAVVCIDSYHYFGCEADYLETHLLPLIKPGGLLLFVVPGMIKDVTGELPPEMALSWTKEDVATLRDMAFWRKTIGAASGVELLDIYELEDFDECWGDWLACDNEYAVGDRKAMNAGAGKYMNLIAMALKRK
jgi:cyclopropane fatty-acyl-phospholipid synthase-like methyltransferase